MQKKKRYLLAGVVAEGGLTIQSQGVTRVDVYINNRPALSVDVKDGTALTALTPAAGSAVLLEGFDGEQVAVSWKV